jgi:putative transposase
MGDPAKIEGGTAVKETVPVVEATRDEAVLPERVQEALGQLVGAAKEGLLALSVEVGLGVLRELLEQEVEEVVARRAGGTRSGARSGMVTRAAR